MNYKAIIRMLGLVLLTEAALLLLPLGVAAMYGDHTVPAFLFTISLVGITGAVCLRVKPKSRMIFAREGFVIVSFSWILLSMFGALPFWFSGEIPHYVDALFETVSGFTTTGASILTNVEAMSRGLLFWRSFTHWIGGMGILVFVIALLPATNERSMHVMRAEVPGPSVGKLVPKIRTTAMLLYAIYLFLTLTQIVLMCAGGMPLFDSILTAFGTAGTGGFGIKNSSIAFYDSAYIDGVVTVFMLLFGINFNLYFLILTRNVLQALKSEELRWYLLIAGGSMAAITLNILPQAGSIGHAFRLASFQVGSIMTTTGFATADFNLWPDLSKTILFLLMMIGACGGSTGGGIKVSRLIIIVKKLSNEITKMVHPRSVRTIRLDGKIVDDETSNQTNTFFICYIFLAFGMTLLVSLDSFDFETTLSAVIACIGNIGPGFGLVGPAGNFAAFSPFAKCVLSMAMLLGRLEIFPLILALAPSLYTRNRHEMVS